MCSEMCIWCVFHTVEDVKKTRKTTRRPPPSGLRGGTTLSAQQPALLYCRPTVLLSAANEEQRGELRSVGRDVLALMIEGERRETIHVAIDAIDHLVILGR